MNRNRKKAKVIIPVAATAALTAVLCINHLQPVSMEVKTQISRTAQAEYENQLLDTAAQLTDSNGEDVTKEEIVYVTAGTDGTAKNIIVSDWLKNNENSGIIKDATDLINIKNVKGDETFTQNKEAVTWNADGADIYYQGKTDKELPVELKISYYLNDKKIEPKDLVGKSGTVKIRYEFENNSVEKRMINGVEEEIYTPFTTITGMILPTDQFKNVKVTNGKVVSDGSKVVVIGIAMPGLEKSLGLDKKELEHVNKEIEIPDYVEISAQVNNFSLGLAVTVMTPELLADMKLNQVESFDTLEENVNKAKDAVRVLVDGTIQLDDGTTKIVSGAEQLNDGVKTLLEKTGEFSRGLSVLNEKTGTFVAGVNQLNNKSGEFTDGIITLDQGVGQLEEGTNTLAAGASQLKNGIVSVNQGADKLKTGLNAAKEGAGQLAKGAGELESGTAQLSKGTASLVTGSQELKDGIEKLNGNYELLASTIANDEHLIAALKQVNQTYHDATINEIITQLEVNTSGQKQLAEGLTEAGTQLVSGAAVVEEGNQQINDNMKMLAVKTTELFQGSKSVSEGVEKLYAGSEELVEGTLTLIDAGEQVESGAVQLENGANALKNGSSSLVGGTDALVAGIEALSQGGEQLAVGVQQLDDGGRQLHSGTEIVYQGIRELADGTMELKKGTKQLRIGVGEMKEKTVDELSDVYEDELKSLIERAEAVQEMAEKYQTFTKLDKDQNGSVKFLIRMEAIEK